MAENTIQIVVGSQNNATPNLDALKAKLDELGKKVANATVNVEDKQATANLLALNAKLVAISSKVASPKISLAGAANAEAQLAALDVSLDRLNKTISPDIQTSSLLSKLKGIASALGTVGKAVSGKGDTSLLGPDTSLLDRLKTLAMQPGGIGLIGAGSQGTSLISMLKSSIGKGAALLTNTAGGGAGSSAARGIIGGALPGILGMGGKASSLLGIGGSLLGTLPSLLAGAGSLGIGAAGLGASGLLLSGIQNQISPLSQAYQSAQAAQAGATTPAQAKAALQQMQAVQQKIGQLSPAMQSVFTAEQKISSTWQSFTASFAPVFAKAMSTASQVFQQLQPVLKSFFSNAVKLVGPLITGLGSIAKEILPGLGKAFAAVAPLMAPMLDGLGKAVAGLLPGLISLLKGAQPAVSALFGGLAIIGKGLGEMFQVMAPAVKASAVVLNGLLSLVSGLLPILGKLAAMFATALAPVFADFAQVIKSLLPVFLLIGKVIADFAGAVLTDLVSVFGALATLVKDISPALATLAKALGQVFNVLENSGVFAILGNVIESLVPLIAKLINQLVGALAPALPPLIKAFGQVASILAGALGVALGILLQALTPVIVLAAKLVTGFVDVLSKTHLLVPVVGALTIAWLAMNSALLANPFVAIGLAIALVAGLIVKYHEDIWQVILKTWNDVKSFVTGIWNDILSFAKNYWPLLLGVGGIVYKYHQDIWQFIQTIWHDVENFFTNTWDRIKNVFSSAVSTVESTLSKAWSSVTSAIHTAWSAIINYFSSLAGKLVNAVGAGGKVLYNWGKMVIDGIGSGARAVWDSVLNFFKSLPSDILHALGIHSPPAWAIDAGKHIMNGIGIGMSQAKLAASSVAKSLSAGVTGALTPGGSAGQNAALAKKMYPQWASGNNWLMWNYIAMAESGWDSTAMNAGSGAFGIAQALGHGVPGGGGRYGNQYGGYGLNVAGDRSANNGGAGDQIAWMHNYILSRYGSLQAAYDYHVKTGVYASGGATGSGLALVGEHGRELISLPGGSHVYSNPDTDRMLSTGGAQTVTIEITGGQSDFDNFMLTWLRKQARIKGGGNVQLAFGKAS